MKKFSQAFPIKVIIMNYFFICCIYPEQQGAFLKKPLLITQTYRD